jgi:iron complex outermembrane recepter protein
MSIEFTAPNVWTIGLRGLATGLLSIGCSILPALTEAQGVSPAKPPETTTEDVGSLKFDSEVTVTATRKESIAEREPVSTAVVTKDEINVRNIPTLDRAIELTAGVYVFRARGTADPSSRVSLRGFNGANRTLTLLDGMPLNDAYTGDVTWTSLPTGEIERVEVVRGPFSSLYGGNAMGGVINLVTRAIDRRQLSLTAQGGSYRTAQFGGHFSDRIGPLGLSIGYQRWQTDGYAPREVVVAPAAAGTGTVVTGAIATQSATGTPAFIVGTAGENWYDQDAARIKGEWSFDASTNLAAQYLFQRAAYGYDGPRSYLRDASDGLVNSGAILLQDGNVQRRLTLSPGTFLQGPGDDRSHLVGLTFHRAFRSGHMLRLSGGAYIQPDSATRTPTVATATAVGGPGVIAARNSRSRYVNAQDYWSFNRHTVSVGFDLRSEQSDNREFALPDWTNAEVRSAQTFSSFGRTRTLAAYLQDELRLSDRVSLIAGARIDHWRTFDGSVNIFNAAVPPAVYDPRTTSSVNGKASVAYRPAEAWTLRSSIGTAFRNPTVFELYRTFRLSTGTLFAANPDLQPERLLAAEVGVARSWGARGSLEATYYRNAIDDLIYRKTDLAVDPSGRYRVLVNAGQGTTDGVEIAAVHRLSATLLARGSYTFTNAIISRNAALPETEGKRVPNIPEHMASIALFYARDRWSGSANGRYVSGTFGLDTNLDTTKGVPGSYSPFFVAGASVAFRAVKQVELFASLDNIFDRQYYVFYLNPGRTVSAGARLRLGVAQ